jgi:hypothetical protein
MPARVGKAADSGKPDFPKWQDYHFFTSAAGQVFLPFVSKWHVFQPTLFPGLAVAGLAGMTHNKPFPWWRVPERYPKRRKSFEKKRL